MVKPYCLIILALLGVVVGCSGIKNYPNTLTKNWTVSLSKDSDADVKARVVVFSVDSLCNGEYLGRVPVKDKPVDIGIPNGEQSLLAFYFSRTEFLGETSSVNVDALVKPRTSYRYEAKLSYVEGMYDVNLYEIKKSSGKRKSLEIVDLNACQETDAGK